MALQPHTNPFGRSDEPQVCSFPSCPHVQPHVRLAHQHAAIAYAAHVVMSHYADSHWHAESFEKMVEAMEPLRQALVDAGYGLPPEEKKS